jgi:hypothetical protein
METSLLFSNEVLTTCFNVKQFYSRPDHCDYQALLRERDAEIAVLAAGGLPHLPPDHCGHHLFPARLVPLSASCTLHVQDSRRRPLHLGC